MWAPHCCCCCCCCNCCSAEYDDDAGAGGYCIEPLPLAERVSLAEASLRIRQSVAVCTLRRNDDGKLVLGVDIHVHVVVICSELLPCHRALCLVQIRQCQRRLRNWGRLVWSAALVALKPSAGILFRRNISRNIRLFLRIGSISTKHSVI